MRPDHPQLEPAIEAVARACRITRRVQQDLAALGELTKDDRSPVTVADFAAQAIVARVLRSYLGPIQIVGEEDADALRGEANAMIRSQVVQAVRQDEDGLNEEAILEAIDACNHDASADSYWTVDPVDGTKGFLRGQQYAIALGLIVEGQLQLGVMGCPNLPVSPEAAVDSPDPNGVIYYATAEGGAFELADCNSNGTAKAITCNQQQSTAVLRFCESQEASHSNHSATQRIADHLGSARQPVRLDSQCKYAIVARGQADAYLRLPTRRPYVEKIWDHAAGALIATEAGAIVSDISGAPLDFSTGSRLQNNRGVVCATPSWHQRIIEAIDDLAIAAASPQTHDT